MELLRTVVITALVCDVIANDDVNLALGRPTRQSSLNTNMGVAEHAVDGNTNGEFRQMSCTETDFQSNPWWSVELYPMTSVNRVIVTNRKDCCNDRLHDFVVGLATHSPEEFGNAEIVPLTRCASHAGIVGRGASVELMCQPVPTLCLYLVIQIPGTNERLTLCEVQVYGSIHLQFMDMSANPIVGPNEIGKLNDGDTSTCAALDRSDMTKALILKGDTIPAQNINILVTARDVDFHVSRTCAPTQMVFHQLTPTGKHTERAVMCTEQPGNNASHYLLTCNCTPSFCNNVTIFISYTSFEADFGYLCAVNIIYL